MRICVVASSLKTLGGQAVQASEIVNRLSGEVAHISLLPINPSLGGVWGKLQRYKYIRTLITSAVFISSLLKSIPKYDVLHVFSASYLSFLLAPTPSVLLGKLFRKRVLLNYHSGEAEDHLRRSERTIRWVLKYVDVVVVPSVFLQQVFERFGIETKVVFNVLNDETFTFVPRNPFQPQFIVTRNLEPMYNVACVIKAFRLIQDRHSNASLTVVGSGKEERYLKGLSQKLGLEHVEFAGKIEREGIGQFYRENDFMLNASNIDNMPMSILEAFSAGLPVISTAAGGIPYMIRDGENGMLVPLDDHRALAEKALFLLENQETARRVADAAHNDVTTLYSWPAIRDKWLALYNGSQ